MDHNWTIQLVMELQKSVVELSTKVQRLMEDRTNDAGKIDQLVLQASYLKGWIAGAVIIVSVVFAGTSFLVTQALIPYLKTATASGPLTGPTSAITPPVIHPPTTPPGSSPPAKP